MGEKIMLRPFICPSRKLADRSVILAKKFWHSYHRSIRRFCISLPEISLGVIYSHSTPSEAKLRKLGLY